ncbi:MAG: isoprenylcysteine carboxylmethyltransferase family protein [Firmicutes bacterium]|nr:isoprenylcysteine carboxylmethyltransferase family protein [Alicyclobacillaceae bacterium]MCL6497410.1 isoprenylcysteine carboxylmethyltransferase family protein [Bacillota bacterium]
MNPAIDVLFLVRLGLEWVTVRRRLRPGAAVRDRGSRWAIAVAMAVALGGADVALARAAVVRIPPWPEAVRFGGLFLMAAGIGFRQWAIQTLGPWFSPRVTLEADQVLVTRGPYRVLRHPAYAGAWLAVTGAGIATGYTAAAVVLASVPLFGWLYRIQVEEQALAERFGEAWQQYARRTWRLFPGVY